MTRPSTNSKTMSVVSVANVRFRCSLYVVADIQASGTFTSRNDRSIRPGFGLPPKLLAQVLGKRAAISLKRRAPLELHHIFNEDIQS